MIRFIAAADRALLRGPSINSRGATAHAEFAMPCALYSDIRGIEAAERAAIHGTAAKFRREIDQAEVVRWCAIAWWRRRRAAAARACSNVQFVNSRCENDHAVEEMS